MQRRLTAILAADVVGYSRLMGTDEAATHQTLKAHREELIQGTIVEHQGRIFKLTGDGMLVEFPSVVNAVSCSVAIQRGMRERNLNVPSNRRAEFRIGINLGDVIVEGEDIYGDGVNVAARLEAIAEPGGISISAAVREQVGDRLDLSFDDTGDQRLKNIAWPVRVFRVRWEKSDPAAFAGSVPLSLPHKPSIAVLPFTNMSDDPEQGYFADGLVDDLITNLSKNPGLFVIARNSSFTYRGQAVDIRKVASELGVRYVLEGSVRKSSNRLRITVQLIEGAGATHVWADKFEGQLADVFDLQDRLTESIVGAIEPSLRRAEIERAISKRPDRLDAYDLYLRAVTFTYANTATANDKALWYLTQSLQVDPGYAIAHAYSAWCLEQRFFRQGFNPADRTVALLHAETVLRHGSEEPQALAIAAFVHANLTHDYETAISALDRSLALNGNSALAYGFSALVAAHSEQCERAASHALKALRLSPHDQLNYHAYAALAQACLLTGQHENAVKHATSAIQSNPHLGVLHCYLAIALTKLDHIAAAETVVEHLREVAPGFTIQDFVGMGVWGPAAREDFAAMLLKAGLRESSTRSH